MAILKKKKKNRFRFVLRAILIYYARIRRIRINLTIVAAKYIRSERSNLWCSAV